MSSSFSSLIDYPKGSFGFSFVLNWLEFICLSPCPQRILLSAINVVFLLVFTVITAKWLTSRFRFGSSSGSSFLDKPLLGVGDDNPDFKITIWFKISFVVTAVLALAYVGLTIFSFIQGIKSQWDLVDLLFRFFQAVMNTLVLYLINVEKKFGAVSHSLYIRLYWGISFVLVCLFTSSSLVRVLFAAQNVDPPMLVDDVFSLSSFPLYIFLFVAALRGSNGIISSVEEDELESKTGGYGAASLLSRTTWNWMNPVLREGYKSALKMEQVPSLPLDHQAERMAQLFEQYWPKPEEESKNPVRTMLLRCFWKDLAFTGFLAAVRLAVMYAGPVLIQSFINFSSEGERNLSEGVVLIVILFVSKVIEVLSSHQFTFLSQKLGMLIRSTLIAGLYKKGLRLTCSSRQGHGVGQIVNYMAVDCQQLSDVVYQLHTLWMMPFQVGIALLLLYVYVGASVLVSLVAAIGVMFLTVMITGKNNAYQFNVMQNRDLRMKATTEMLNNMRVIKFQAWEQHFFEKIQNARLKEYGWLSKFMYMIGANLALMWSIPLVIAALTFGVAILMGVHLDAATVFTATTVFKILQEPIQNFPQTLTSVSQMIVSLGRLDRYLTSHELEDKNVERDESCDATTSIAVEVKNGTFSWEDEGEETVLQDLSFQVKKGELAAIVGTVGSGKSSALAAILGELHKISGKVRVCGTTAYVAQTSWIQNATIRENILFGSPMDDERYSNAIKACSLEKDFEVMEHGDQTEIGERGINLSGGQKQRIQLARAVYQDCDIYLLDDIFSAVDAHTGTEIFKKCIRGVLMDRTILLVTHQMDLLHNADIILVLRDGKIVQSGKYGELRRSGSDFSALVEAHENSMELVEANAIEKASESSSHKQVPNSPRNASGQSEVHGEPEQSKSNKGSSKLIEEEEREAGRVSLNVYKQYCTESYGWWGITAVLLVSVLWQLSQMGSDYWLAYETSNKKNFVASLFIGVYSGIAVVSCIFVAARSLLVAFLGLKTAQSYFNQMLNSVLRAPMSFFDTTPSGRVLSRASSDQTNIDFLIPLFIGVIITMYFSLLGILFMTSQYAWPTVIVVLPLIWLNMWYQGYYIKTSRELTRLDQITKAPIIHHFSETVSGVMTIRCFRKQDRFFEENLNKVNLNLKMSFHNVAANEWFGFRLEFIGSFFLCIVTVFLIFLPSSIITPEYVGLALSYGLPLNSVLYFAVYLGSILENRMVSVERMKQFINIPSEAPWRKHTSPSSADWPNRGEIQIKGLQVRYRDNTPLVLKGISLSINGGEKTGVVGRTGSGKSTLIQVFFRLVEPYAGRIVIDGLDICELGLHDLRSCFGIIPQEPVLFEGTVRSNIDPLGLYTDDQIWKSLERCQLKEVVLAKPEKLDSSVVDSGDNWSVGQRQLLCLGRVMLKRGKILFMDEATASVDSQTDAVIQRIIRQDFAACTIITIAHRIPTVMDCDRVLVMDGGRVKEFDRPAILLDQVSLFGALVQEYANRLSSL